MQNKKKQEEADRSLEELTKSLNELDERTRYLDPNPELDNLFATAGDFFPSPVRLAPSAGSCKSSAFTGKQLDPFGRSGRSGGKLHTFATAAFAEGAGHVSDDCRQVNARAHRDAHHYLLAAAAHRYM